MFFCEYPAYSTAEDRYCPGAPLFWSCTQLETTRVHGHWAVLQGIRLLFHTDVVD